MALTGQCPIPHDPYKKKASKTFTINFVAEIETTTKITVDNPCTNQPPTEQEFVKKFKTNVGNVKLTAKWARPMVNPTSGDPISPNGPFGPYDWSLLNQAELDQKSETALDKAKNKVEKIEKDVPNDEVKKRPIECRKLGPDKCIIKTSGNITTTKSITKKGTITPVFLGCSGAIG
jgi:hypothetical protein